MSGSLADRTAFVTGATRGVGRAIAEAFALEGAALVVAGRDPEALEAVEADCRKLGAPQVRTSRFDVTDESAVSEAVAGAVAELGAIDVLVNNAGIAESAKFTDVTLDQWRRIMAVDVEGPFLLTRAVLPGMLERRRGTVVSVASVASRIGLPYVAAYTAAKHALLGMTRSLAAEYARSGVTFNCVCPFYIDTPMTETTVASISAHTGRNREQSLAALLNPQGRLTDPAEIAAMCVLLASDVGRGINGQGINIDGGRVQA
ncbi:SDR family NAD(P)-dependent oxidoreductase [Pseudonocardia alni]|uniref:SDR family NAD(P)-dependent oxidoreductase n=1 Tax=Pseudonocardia alni TaxID=33907 RepID=UPI00332886BB